MKKLLFILFGLTACGQDNRNNGVSETENYLRCAQYAEARIDVCGIKVYQLDKGLLVPTHLLDKQLEFISAKAINNKNCLLIYSARLYTNEGVCSFEIKNGEIYE